MGVGERYWVGVASREHVLRAVEGGFAQLSHGKRAPLERMAVGDWLVYYSPKTSRGGEPLQAFTAIGRVVGEEAYRFDLGGGFVPFRRDVAYLRVKEEAPVRPLINRLSFVRNRQRWGQAFRSGHFGMRQGDFELIAEAMGLSLVAGSADRPEGPSGG